MAMKTRLPGNVLWIILWSLFAGGFSLFFATLAPKPAVRAGFALFGALHLVGALGLYRMAPWGRVFAGSVLLLSGLLQAVSLLKGIDGGKLARLGMYLYFGVYLFLPSTRRLFAASHGTRVDRVGCLVQACFGLLTVGALVLGFALTLPKWVTGTSFAVVAFLWIFFEQRLTARIIAWFGPRPDDLTRATWAPFRAAREAWRAKDFPRAETLLAPLPATLSVRVLRGLIRMDRAESGGGLDRVLYAHDFVADPAQREALRQECETADLDARVAERAAFIDDLLEDDARPYPLFPEQTDERLQRVTGRIFMSHAEFQHREAWATARPLCTGPRARVWLTLRLWDAQCPEAALVAAAPVKDPGFSDLAVLIARLESCGADGINEVWLLANAYNICLLPGLADAARLLYLDSPYLEAMGSETVAARLTARIEFIALLRRLRSEYPPESVIEIPWLLALLVGGPQGVPHRKAKFERWWAQRRSAQLDFDGAIVSGLDAARANDWVRAERAFADAVQAWPERTCASYNHALTLLHLDRAGEAEAAFRKLAAQDPDEAVYWMRIGDARRVSGRTSEALEAYQSAARLGGLEEQVAIRMGMTLASEGREDEAERQLDPVVGPGSDPDKIEELAAYLESQGIYRLAARFRERAFHERLNERISPEEETGDADEDLEPTA